MPFTNINQTPKGYSAIEASVDDKCLKIWQQYKNEEKVQNIVHYVGAEKLRELIEYLEDSLVEIELQKLGVTV